MDYPHNILKVGIDAIEVEISALKAVKKNLGASFLSVVRCAAECKGRLIVSGVGKSAIIAQKMVATLNSTGAPAIFMHAADAIHGDLGVVRAEDVVICISKSGETPEIKVLIPLLKNFGNTLVAIVAVKDSYLGRAADFVLWTPVEREADSNNLAPTASAAAQMAMGDALAMALLAIKGFTASDFAKFHPGGALGKQLYLRVRDVCLNHEKPTVHPDDSIRHVIMEITSKRLGAAVAVDDAGRIAGVVTDGDLRRMLSKEENIHGLTARDVMSVHPKKIRQDALAVEALALMRQFSITQLVAVDDEGLYIGIVHLHDLLKEGIV